MSAKFGRLLCGCPCSGHEMSMTVEVARHTVIPTTAPQRRRTALKRLIALAVVTSMFSAAPAFAKKSGHHASKSHASKAKKSRGETCWRTNRHTGQRFRIC